MDLPEQEVATTSRQILDGEGTSQQLPVCLWPFRLSIPSVDVVNREATVLNQEKENTSWHSEAEEDQDGQRVAV